MYINLLAILANLLYNIVMNRGYHSTGLDPRVRTNFNVLYGELGKDDVELRQDVYRKCVAGDKTPIDYDAEVIMLAGYLAIDRDATCLDVGSSRPDFSEKLHKAGYNGLLFAVDPNSRQFGERSFWKPRTDNLWEPHLDEDINIDTLLHYYDLQGDDDPEHQGIFLIEAIANRIPLPDEFVDFCTEMFSLYHVDKIDDALMEIKRLLEYSGQNVMTLSRNKNKAWMHEGQDAIKDVLSDVLKQEVSGPTPLHAGFTVEDAELILKNHFLHNHIRNINETLIFDTEEKCEVVHAAQLTQARQFKTKNGESVSIEDFEIAYEATVGKQLRQGLNNNNPVSDLASRAIIVSSRRGMDLPDEYERQAV